MLVALTVLVAIGAFILGITVSWLAKGYVEDFIENAAYAKSVTHPEMLDEDGNILHDDLIYIRPDVASFWDETYDDEDDDE
ncbi:hypothetical protein [Synechococcus phage S-B64]|uniref:Uncharacterized protein n=2 Tax=Shandvirus TaxID=2948904 RepID=A0A1Z1LWD9_9CAUD|nr:hypothetical protein KNT63_gp085 [Synechococcus phage S-H35]YP_010095351.1 hypothetical protein KNT88_gp113 [Synechococcus phage S-B64]ARW56966.1 hypothetical protein [Synechococcus phage S-H35]AWD90149.1 hypothetical protein [Synechococcus phage S-B64]